MILADNIVSRRDILGLTSLISTSIIGGCIVGTPYEDRSPELLFVRVDNESENSVSAEIRISNEQSEGVWRDTLTVSSQTSERRETDLTGKRYNVAVTVTPESETGSREQHDEWQWGGCERDAFHIEITDSEINIGKLCWDD